MRTRVLPREEWPRLKGTEAEALWPLLDPETARVVAVEEDDGRIVATWTMMRVVHAECLWIAPSHRGSFGVFKRLVHAMRDVARSWNAKWVMTASVSDSVTAIITRLGGVPVPGLAFSMPVAPPRGRAHLLTDRELGRAFHEQLAGQVEEPLHAEDEEHDERVGRALRLAVDGADPARATEEYNAWARGAGYAPVLYLGAVDGLMRADIGAAKVEIGEDYLVRVVEEGVCR